MLPRLSSHLKNATVALLFAAGTTGLYAADPVIGNLPGSNPSANDTANSVDVFNNITISDADSSDDVIVEISYDESLGSFNGNDFDEDGSGAGYSITIKPTGGQSDSDATDDLQALRFDPAEDLVAPGSTQNVVFTILVTDTNGDTDTASVTLVVTSVNDSPVLTPNNPQPNLTRNDDVSTAATLFGGATVTDPDTSDPITVTVTLTNTANGTFGGLSSFSGSGNTRTLSSSNRDTLRDAIRGITFLPIENRIKPGTTDDSTITVSISDGDASDSVQRTIRVTSINDNPVVAINGNVSMDDDETETIFSAVTVSDVDADDDLTVKVSYPTAKGVFTNLAAAGFSNPSSSGGTSTVTLSAQTPANAQSKLRLLVFDPTPDQVEVGQSENVDFNILVTDESNATNDTSSNNDRLRLSVASVNEPPVVANTGDVAVALSGGQSSLIFAGITVTDPDVQGDGGAGEGSGDDFTARIVVTGGAVISSDFTESSTNNFTYTGRLSDLQTAIQAAFYSAPSSSGTFTATVSVSDSETPPLTSNSIVFTATVTATTPGITGKLEGQQVNDDSTIRPFSTIEFRSFGAVSETRDVVVKVAKALGAFDILGSFTASSDSTNNIYILNGSAVSATDAIQNLRFNPVPNRAIPEAGATVPLTIEVRETDLTDPGDGTLLASDSLNITVVPVNDTPQIGSDSPEIRINDDQTTMPFENMVITEIDEAGTQEVTVTISLIGEDVNNNAPKAGGGTLSSDDSDFERVTIDDDDDSNTPEVPTDTYTFSGTPAEVNAILNAILFTPTPDRNGEGERETITFTVLVEDDFGGAAQRNDTTVIVLAVNGAPLIDGIPPLARQPFPTPGSSDAGGVVTANPFADITVTDDELPTGPDTLTFVIELDDPDKGTLTGGGFVTNDDGASYTFSGTPAQITTALDSVVYTLSQEFPFTLSEPGLTEFTLSATDSPPASNTTIETLEITIRQTVTAHIVCVADDYASDGTPIDGSLRQAIENAGSNDFIVFDFPSDDYPVTIRLVETIDIDKNLNIVGSGVDLLAISGDTDGDGTGDVGIFTVSGGAALTLEQLTLEHGAAASYGGAVSVGQGSSLAARFCSFEDNTAGQFGGAIDMFKGELTIEQCLFVNNNVEGPTAKGGGAVSIFATGSALINNSTFVGNQQLGAGGDGGGAIFAQNDILESQTTGIPSVFELLVEHCTFKDNFDAVTSGSAILSATSGATVKLRNNLFTDEQGLVLDVLGGGIFDSLGGNIATDATITTYTQGGSQLVTILDSLNDTVSSPDLVLLPLADNGGATLTCALGDGSPAIDYAQIPAPVEDALGVDQRGVWRSTQPDSGAYESGVFKRLNINEVFTDTTQFLEFYNPRDSETLDVEDLVLCIDGAEIHTFSAASYDVGVGFTYDVTGEELNTESGLIQLKNVRGQEVLRVRYAMNFAKSNVALDTDGESVTRYPRFEGGFLPHELVTTRVTGVPDTGISPSSKGFDVNGAELNGGNAPPIAVEDDGPYAISADETLDFNVLENDIEFDRTDILKITEVMAVSAGSVTSTELPGSIDLVNLPTSPQTTVDPSNVDVEATSDALAISYDPRTSPTMIALSKDETITDIWGYTILDFIPGDPDTAQARGTNRTANIERATSYFLVTVTGINEAPVAGDEPTVGTPENQALRFLIDPTYLAPEPFDFGDLDANYKDQDSFGNEVTLKPNLVDVNLLANDDDVDNDDDRTTIEVVGVHPDDTSVQQTTTSSALGALVTLDIRASRDESSIVYDPRASATLNALAAGETVEDSFYYTVIDRHGAIDTAKVTITVTGVNDVPTANDDPDYFGTQGEKTEIVGADLLANDTDPDQDSNGPDDAPTIVNDFPRNTAFGAEVSFDGTTLTFDPTGLEFYDKLARNEIVVDSFTYTISDGNDGTSEATVFIEFVGINDTPEASNDLLTINENESTAIDAAVGVLNNDEDIDINGTSPDDDPWVLPQLEVTTPLGAAFNLYTDGSYDYDANSAVIESLFEGELAVDTFPYIVTDNSRTSAADDCFKVSTNSIEVVIPVLANDDVAGTEPVAVEAYAADEGDANVTIIESDNHQLRNGTIVKIEGYEGSGHYIGVFAITAIDRDHFSIPVAFADDPEGTRGTYRPWFNITAFGETDEDGLVQISDDQQTLTYTPKVNFFGTETFTYTIEDGAGGQDVAVVEMLVIDPPLNSEICANDDSFTVFAGQGALEFNVLDNDNTLPALGSELTITEVVKAGSETGTATVINGGQAISYEPVDDSFTGTESFVYTVNGGGTSTATAIVTFEVIAVENLLTNHNDDFVVENGSTDNVLDVLGNDANLPNYPLTLELVSVSGLPSGSSGSVVDGKVNFTPPDTIGVVSFDYLVRDELGNELTKSVDVRVVDDETDDFYAIADHYIVWAGAPAVQLTVLDNDAATGVNSSDFTIVNLGLDTDAPPQVSRVGFDGTVVNYTAPDDVPPGGTEEFKYEISDGTTERREALITITVVDNYPAIAATDDDYCIARDSSGQVLDVLLNDPTFPVVGWDWTITDVSTPDQGGAVSINAGETVTYTPAADFFGTETFTYTIEDAFGQSDSATVTVLVGSLITCPDEYTVLENSSDNPFPVLVNDDFLDRYASDYKIVAITQPANGTVVIDGTDVDNQLLFTPDAEFVGSESFTYTIEDLSGGTKEETVTVTVIDQDSDRAFAELRIEVTGVNDAPVLGGTEDDSITDKQTTFPFDTVTLTDIDENGDQEQTATVAFDKSLGTIDFTAAPVASVFFFEDPVTITYTIIGTPAEVQAALRSIEFTPTENIRPPIFYDAVFTLTIDDGYIDPVITDLTTVEILAINDAPVPEDDSYATFENQAIRILADDTLINETFDFGDLAPDFVAVNATGQNVTLKPALQIVSLLDNDNDVDIDDDNVVTDPDTVATLEVINVHTTNARVDQIVGTTALGASVTLDIRAVRAETNIVYDPRGSAILNALRAGEQVTDSFYYTVRDKHGAFGTARVDILITGVNDVPTANNDGGYEAGEDGSINILGDEVLDNDTDPDIDLLRQDDDPIISNIPATSNLGANLSFDGTNITYDTTGVPLFEALARNEFVEDFITYTISDEEGGFSTATISLEVEGFNDAPIADDDLLEIDENDTQSRIRGTGLISNDTEIDIDGSVPDDDHWIIPQREVTTPLGAALNIETDGSYTYDANSMFIDSMIEGELQVEIFPYIVIDNFRTSTAPDNYKVIADSTDVLLPVLSNDDVAGSVPIEILGYAEDTGDAGRVIIESTNHELRDGLLIKIQSYSGSGAYNGVFPISVEDRNHFSIETPFVDDPDGTRGTWRPWFNITAVGETDQEGEVTINTDAQSILYTPKTGFLGTETFEYTIEDGVGGQDVTLVTLTVLQAPLNTVISASDDRFQIGEGESSVEVDVLANDNTLPALGTALTVTEVTPTSATGSLDITNGGKALSYTPASTDFTGTEIFTYTVTGGGSSTAQATITIEVLDRTNFLDGNDDDFVVIEDSIDNLLDVAGNDASLPSFPVSFELDSVGTPSAGGAVSIAAGKVSYTPLAGFTGTETFDYTIRDGSGGNRTQTVTVQVVEDVDDFYAKHDRYIVLAGSGELELPVLRNDDTSGATPIDALLIINLGLDTEAPPEVSRVSFTDDVVRYTAPHDTGTEIFNYEITDGTDQRREAIITIEIVDELPTKPNALGDDFHVEKNADPVDLDVLLNDIPLPDAGWVWTIDSVTQPAPETGGTVVNNGGTSITYTPAHGFYGVESFTYTIIDSFGDTASTTVTVTVGEQLTEPDYYVVLENSVDNDFPVLVNDDILERFPADYTINEVSVPDAGGAVVVDGDGPNNQLLYAPLADFVGVETFSYTVIDNTGATLTETVTVEVIAEESDRDFADFRVEITGVNDIPVVASVSDGATTDKQTVKPFPSISITDKDGVTQTVDFADFGVQEQTVIMEYDTFYGTVATPGMTSLGNGRYRVIGTPAEVSAVLQDVVFTPYENLIDYIDPGQDDVDFNLSIDDGYVVTPVTATATITITPIDDAPTIALEIPDQFFQVNSPNRGYLLTPHFADVDDDVPGGQITWTVAGNTNAGLFDSVSIDQAKQLVVFDFAADQFGVAEITIRGTDRGLLFVEDTFTVTVDGPPVIDLPVGEDNPARAIPAGNRDFFRQDFRQAFRVMNDGELRADAFIVHLDNFFNGRPLDVTVESAAYSTGDNGTPNFFNDDPRTSVGVDVNVIAANHPVQFAVKFDVPLEPGESTVVHFIYRANELDNDPVRPDVRIELIGATPSEAGLLLDQLDKDNGDVCLTVNLQVGIELQLEYSEDLSNWTPWATPLPVIDSDGFDQEYKVVDDGLNTDPHPSLVPQRYYRVVDITPAP